MVLVVLAKTILRSNAFAHEFTYLILFAAYIAVNYRIKAFNYPRLWMWHFLGLIGVLWIALLATLNSLASSHVVFVVLLFTGWGILAIIGLILQKQYFPSMLYKRSGRDISLLLKFVFGKEDKSILDASKSFDEVPIEVAVPEQHSSRKILPEGSLSLSVDSNNGPAD
jgi:hypothetical protein